MNWRLLLSKIVPVPMRSTYSVAAPESVTAGVEYREEARWWQWRGRIFRHWTRKLGGNETSGLTVDQLRAGRAQVGP